MTLPHILLALAVMAVWGTNFVVIKYGLATLPPFEFAALRFFFSALPWLFFIRKPDVPWRTLAAFGVLLGGGMFGVMFYAMRADISPGLASLLVQVQVFFTIGLSMLIRRERLQAYQVAALVLCVASLAIIVFHNDATVTDLGTALVLFAALCWAASNIVVKSAGAVNMLAFMVWSSVFAVPPLLIVSLLLEGPEAMLNGIQQADAIVWTAVLWQSIGNTLFGYGAWTFLLTRYPAGTAAPFALLVPVFGMSASAWLINEPMQDWKILGAVLLLAGLALNVLWPRLRFRA